MEECGGVGAGLKPAPAGLLDRCDKNKKRRSQSNDQERQARRYYLPGGIHRIIRLGPPECQKVVLERLTPFRWLPQRITRIARHSVWELTSAHFMLFDLEII